MDYKWFLFSLEGRVNRKALWLNFVVPYIVIAIIVGVIDGIAGTIGVLTTIYNIVLIYPYIAVLVKRCHDRNRTGWFIIIGLIPILNIWFLVEAYFLKGTTGSNKYGEDPLGGETPSDPMAGEAQEPTGPGSVDTGGESNIS